MNIKGHFETITRHKLLVMKYCFACGLYEQGLAHDLSKYSPTEFIPGFAGGFGLDVSGQSVVGFHLLFDEEPDGPHVRAGIEQGAAGRVAVAARAAGFLIIALQIFRHIVVDDEPDVRLVDAHAEGVGRDHDLDPVV